VLNKLLVPSFINVAIHPFTDSFIHIANNSYLRAYSLPGTELRAEEPKIKRERTCPHRALSPQQTGKDHNHSHNKRQHELSAIREMCKVQWMKSRQKSRDSLKVCKERFKNTSNAYL
jgi:hypothetical protein